MTKQIFHKILTDLVWNNITSSRISIIGTSIKNGRFILYFIVKIFILLLIVDQISFKQEGFSDPPSVSSISRLLRGGRPGDDGKKDYTIDGILGGGEYTIRIWYIKFISSLVLLFALNRDIRTIALNSFSSSHSLWVSQTTTGNIKLSKISNNCH